jgi:hypothetical protein
MDILQIIAQLLWICYLIYCQTECGYVTTQYCRLWCRVWKIIWICGNALLKYYVHMGDDIVPINETVYCFQ